MTNSATTTYSVPEISCGHCKSTIEAAVQGLGDVARVEVDIEAKTVTVEGGPLHNRDRDRRCRLRRCPVNRVLSVAAVGEHPSR